jgi:nucleotidyltransferase/DNA polymerase involved in DNA repair
MMLTGSASSASGVGRARGAGDGAEGRVIACVDMDYFYAQVLEQTFPDETDRGRAPVGVLQGNCCITTCNYRARERGVTKLMSLNAAKKQCPELVILDGSDLTPFRAASERIAAVLEAFGAPVERLGMDESFLDLTDLAASRARQRATQSCFEGHVLGGPATCEKAHEQLLAEGSVILLEMRTAVRNTLGLTCSGGIGTSRLAAKLGAEANKPDQQSTVMPSALVAMLPGLPFRRLQGVGGRAACKALLAAYVAAGEPGGALPSGEYTALLCRHVAALPLTTLERALGTPALARQAWAMVRGEDRRPVVQSEPPKTVSCETTMVPHPRDQPAAVLALGLLCDRLLRLAAARLARRDLPRTLRVCVSDKGPKGDAPRKDRVNTSKQAKVDGAALASSEALLRVATPLLLALLAPGGFCLSRINLAFSDFKESRDGVTRPITAYTTTRGNPEKFGDVDHSSSRVASTALRGPSPSTAQPAATAGTAAVPGAPAVDTHSATVTLVDSAAPTAAHTAAPTAAPSPKRLRLEEGSATRLEEGSATLGGAAVDLSVLDHLPPELRAEVEQAIEHEKNSKRAAAHKHKGTLLGFFGAAKSPPTGRADGAR